MLKLNLFRLALATLAFCMTFTSGLIQERIVLKCLLYVVGTMLSAGVIISFIFTGMC